MTVAELDYIERRIEAVGNRAHDALNKVFAAEVRLDNHDDDVSDLQKRVRGLEIDDWKAKGMIALISFISAGGGVGLVEYIVRHL